jgi:hypothetical protein
MVKKIEGKSLLRNMQRIKFGNINTSISLSFFFTLFIKVEDITFQRETSIFKDKERASLILCSRKEHTNFLSAWNKVDVE